MYFQRDSGIVQQRPHGLADAAEVILDHLAFGWREVIDVLEEGRFDDALGEDGLHIRQAVVSVSETGQHGLTLVLV